MKNASTPQYIDPHHGQVDYACFVFCFFAWGLKNPRLSYSARLCQMSCWPPPCSCVSSPRTPAGSSSMGPDKTAEESEANEEENQKKLRRQFYVLGELQILAEKLNVSTPSTGCRAILRKCVERIILARQTSGRLGVLVEECVQLCMRPCGASSLVLALISDLCHA